MASNGDLGRITDFYTDEEGTVKTVIEFPDGRVVTYETEDLEMIEHANAITIHKSQGSECDIVIIPWRESLLYDAEAEYPVHRHYPCKEKGVSGGAMERSPARQSIRTMLAGAIQHLVSGSPVTIINT